MSVSVVIISAQLWLPNPPTVTFLIQTDSFHYLPMDVTPNTFTVLMFDP